jgi:hypothetical protein
MELDRAKCISSGNQKVVSGEISRMKRISVGQLIRKVLNLFVLDPIARSAVPNAWKRKCRSLLGMSLVVFLWSVPALAQEKNEVGLEIGGNVTPSQGLSPAASLIAPDGTVLTTRNLAIDSSLTLGLEYDHAFVLRQKFAIDGGVDFLASPSDVKLSQPSQNAIGQYAFIFLTPHVRVKFHPNGVFSPWLSFGGGYARFLEKAPAAVSSFKPGTNTGTLEFGGGIDTRTVVHFLRIPIGFRVEVRDFYSGQPNYNQKVIGNLQNNLAFTGGLLIRF